MAVQTLPPHRKEAAPITSMRLTFSGGRVLRACYTREDGAWLFTVMDVISIMTQSRDPRQYTKKMRNRSKRLTDHWDEWTRMRPVSVSPGTRYVARCADWRSMVEIIKEITGKKVRPYLRWLEEEGVDRMEKAECPEAVLIYSLVVLMDVLEISGRPEHLLIETLVEDADGSCP